MFFLVCILLIKRCVAYKTRQYGIYLRHQAADTLNGAFIVWVLAAPFTHDLTKPVLLVQRRSQCRKIADMFP